MAQRLWQGQPSSPAFGALAADAEPVGMRDERAAADADWLAALTATTRARGIAGRLLYAEVVKRAADVVISGVLLVVLLPVLLGIVLALRLSAPGPLLFRQTRVGRGGRPFTVYKFRTMIADRRQRDAAIPFSERRQRHKSAGDPRVTRVGRLLRRTSLDELPQLLNVLRGDMSLIGPRPELPAIVERYEPWQHERHFVRPGISGWWQVNGRGEFPMHENTALDIYYVQHVSPWLDLRIVGRTLLAVVRGGGAF